MSEEPEQSKSPAVSEGRRRAELTKDPRRCPRCDVRGIVDLGSMKPDKRGVLRNPQLLCPECRETFTVKGMVGRVRPGKSRPNQ